MTVRWERRGSKLVRIGPEPSPAHPPAAEPDDYAIKLRRFGQEMRAAVRRYRRPTYGVTPGMVLEARLRARLTQRQLAREVGISRSSVAEGETGGRPIHPKLAEWARAALRGEGA